MEGSKGGEVRRVHVVYFLSHNGKIEQPHLIRVHHLHRNGVHLRDVKRWLSELRGKDMPDSFTWSYKRRYKAGYVWQDLMDDDLITPISDNEYVLKGSELSVKADLPPPETMPNEEEAKKVSAPKTQHETLHIEVDDGISPKPPPPLDQESPGALLPPPPSGSEASDESTKRAAIVKTDLRRQQEEEKKDEEKEEKGVSFVRKNSNNFYWWSGRRTSHVLRNLLKCGGVETNDSVLLPVHRQTILAQKGIDDKSYQSSNPNENRKSRSLVRRKSLKKKGQNVDKPAKGPNCLQCGKAFEPEKLDSHMKSCKALEGRGRSSINQEKLPTRIASEELP